jgi:GNAT superfamily N-acetyltransferase
MNADILDDERIDLRNGCSVSIRPLRRGEEGTVREFCTRLSPRARYLRFFQRMPVVPDSLVRLLADVSDPRRLAVVAELDKVHGGGVLALGHLAVIADDYAELGLVVADAWQRQGIGTVLARKLIDAGAAHGFRRFVAFGLSHNAGWQRVLRPLADIVSMRTRLDVSEVTFVRKEPAAASVIGGSSRAADDLLERAYDRMMAARVGTGSR